MLLAIPCIFSLCGIFSPVTMAQGVQGKLTFGANIRFRYEYQDNFNQLYYGDDPAKGNARDGFVLGRLRTGLDYNPDPDIHLSLWMQNAEVWDSALTDSDFYSSRFGMEDNPNKDRWEMWDTYLEIKKVFNLPVSVKGGRQRICYGDNRVFGPGEWGNSGRWVWDAVKWSYGFEGGFADIYYGKTQLHEPNEFSLNHRHGFESGGFYGHFDLPVKRFPVALEPFLMTKQDDHDRYRGEDQRTGDFDSWYGGIRAGEADKKEFDYDLTYISQAGAFAHDDIQAYGYHLLAGYTFSEIGMKPGLSMEYSFASGDSNPVDGKKETFDGAFGARDMMYGRMNFFHWQNIKDAQVNLEVRPHEKLFIKTEFHKFRLAEREDAWYLNAQAYRDKSGRSGDEVGRELDIVTTFDLSKKQQFQVGFGHFRPDEFAGKVASDKESNWFFCQWSYKFSRAIL